MPDSAENAEFWDSLPAITEEDVRAFFERLRPERDAAARAVARSGIGPEFPGSRWGHLELREVLGRGTSGVVYRALDKRLDREVALKLSPAAGSDDTELPRFYREARELARVRHPNVLLVHGVDVLDGWVGMWTEFIRGHTLEEALKRWGPLEPEDCIAVGLRLCDAAAAVHGAGLVHGDIKSENLMREWGGRLVLVDFGLTGIRGVGVGSTAARGTPLYMAPERFRGAPGSVASDLYSMGVLLYRLLTGDYPIPARSIGDLFDAHEGGARAALPEDVARLSPLLAAAILSALAPEPADRCAGAAELGRRLREARRELRSARATRSGPSVVLRGLPEWLSGFVGREQERGELRGNLDSARLVTLTGAAGCGKSRLAREAVADQLDRARRGERRTLHAVWWVPLAPLNEDAAVASAIAATLEVPEAPARSLLDGVIDRIGAADAILVLDNCERVLDGAASTASALLSRCSALRILTTSREVLGVPGERVLRLQPLQIPPEVPTHTAWTEDALARLSRVEAVRLFLECARLADSTFLLTAENADSVVHICRRLDGIPLALELVAPGVRGARLAEILERVDARLLSASGSARGGMPHHRTLRGAVEWSHAGLDARERALFRRLGIFSGGWTFDAARAVLGQQEVDRLDALDLLSRLTDKSLIEVDLKSAGDSCGQRYRMLQPIREFARDEMERAAELDWTEAAHRRHFTALAGRLAEAMSGPAQGAALASLDADQANFLAALHSYDRRDAVFDDGLGLAADLCAFWRARGHWSEGRATAARMLADPRGQNATRQRARLLVEAAALVYRLGDLEEARALAQGGLEAAAALGEPDVAARAATLLGTILAYQGDREAGARFHADALRISRELPDPMAEVLVLAEAGSIEMAMGEVERAKTTFEDGLSRLPRGVASSTRAILLNNLGAVLVRTGDLVRARATLEEGLEIVRVLGLRALLAACLSNLGNIELSLEDLAAARSRFEESFEIFRGLGERQRAARVLYNLGIVCHHTGDRARARQLLERALTELRELGVVEQVMADIMLGLGDLAEADGDFERGSVVVRDALDLSWRLGDGANALSAVGLLALLALKAGDPRRAARLLGVLDALERGLELRLADPERLRLHTAQQRIVALIGGESYSGEHASGSLLDPDAAVRMTLGSNP